MTDSKLVRLEDCPPGLFRFGKTIGFRSEYSSVTPANPNQPDAYVVASGEYFWGGCTTTEDRSDVMVEPIDIDTLSASSPPVGGSGEPTEPVVWTNLHHLRRYLRGETETLCVIREREREWNMALRLSQSDLQFVPSELRKEMK